MTRTARRAVLLVASLAAGLLSTVPAAQAVSSSCPAAQTYANPVCFSWQGADWLERDVAVPRRPGALLATYPGRVFEPIDGGSGLRPAVALLHGLTGRMQDVWWLARDLAGHGYVVVTVTNGGSDAQTFTDAMLAMEAYLVAQAGPLRIDLTEVGLAGHSAGARAASLVQSLDDVLVPAAVVGLDNLQSTQEGDAGSAVYNPTCLGGAQTPIPPRAPGLGIAMDAQSWTCPSSDPDVKKTPWYAWRAAGQPTVEAVYAGSNHYTFAQTATTAADDGALLRVPAYLARTWFDRWLKDDASAVDRLFDPSAELGTTRDAFLSTQFRSAAFLPDRGVDCEDWRTAACALP